MDPLTAAALIQTGYYGVQSLIDKKKGEEYANTPRPKYEIPAAATMMRNMGVSGMGQYGYAGMGQDIARSEQAMANALGTRGMSGLSGSQKMNLLAALTKGTQQQLGEIGATAERAKRGREQMGYNALQAYAPYEEKQWEWDKKGPYLNAMETASRFEANSRAGMQAAVGMFSNLVAGGGLGGKKPSSPGFRSGVDASGNPVSINPSMPADYVPEGFSMMQAPPEPPPVPDFADQGVRPYSIPMVEPSSQFTFPNAATPSAPMMPYIDPIRSFQMPRPVTKSFAETTLGVPLSDETFDYYNLGDTYNNAFNSLFRQKYSPY